MKFDRWSKWLEWRRTGELTSVVICTYGEPTPKRVPFGFNFTNDWGSEYPRRLVVDFKDGDYHVGYRGPVAEGAD